MSEFTPWRTYSIFISSTFADMQAERDHLKNIVLPKIKEELRKKRIKLEIVDLRWGLDTTSIEQEDEREVTVLKVCLDEIKRCKPFFICLMGDRYGWIPPEKRMDDATTGMDHISHHKGKSVTALEIEFGVLASQEQLVRSVFYFRDTLDYTKFSPEKAAMFSDAHNPVLTEKEKKERGKALEKLKSSITSHFDNKEIKNKVKSYTVNWDAQKEKVINLEAWGEMLFEDIINDCIAHAKYTRASTPKNWQEKELALLDSFIENHTSSFCGREKLLKELKDHLLLKDPNNWGLILTGESGSGKSAVFSMVHKIMRQEDCLVLSHSAGLSAKSRNILDLLQIWNKQLSDFLGVEYLELKPQGKTAASDSLQTDNERIQQAEPKPEIEKIQEKFKELLFTAAEQTQVVLLIDALDRFEPTQRAHYMTWLPTVMPGNIKMLCTAITGTEKKAIEYHSELLVSSIDFFTSEEAKLMLDILCSLQHKSIPLNVERVILEKKRDDGLNAISSPLWLSLAVNILMAMDNDDFEKMQQLEGRGDEVIVNYMETLVNDFPALPGKLFLSLLTKAASVFGEDFTWKTFNYIACSRDGLRESDLEKLIPKSENENWDALLFANLRRWFNRHLREEGENAQWNLVHSILRNSLLEEKDKKTLKGIHNSIASQLLTLAADDELRISETMYHLMEAENTEKALDYYISELTDEELSGATAVLAEAVSIKDKGVDWMLSLIDATNTDAEKILKLAHLLIDSLYDTLAVEGKLNERKIILLKLKTILESISTNFNTKLYYNKVLISLNEKLGEIYQTISDYKKALNHYMIANNLAKKLSDTNPEDDHLLSMLAVSYSKIGELYLLSEENVESLEYLKLSKELKKKLYDKNPQNEDTKNRLAISLSKLGDTYLALEKLKIALEAYEEDFKLTEELYNDNPKNERHKNNLAFSYGKLGDISMKFDEPNEALYYYKNRNKLAQELHKNNPRNETLKKGLAISHAMLGEVYQKLNDPENALDNFLKRRDLAKQLYESNTKNEYFKYGYALSYESLGELYEQYGQLDEALKYYNDSNILYKQFNIESQGIKHFQEAYADSFKKLGVVYSKLGEKDPEHFDNALVCFTNTNILLEKLIKRYPNNKNYIANIALTLMKIGEIHQTNEKYKEALQFFTSSNSIFKELNENNSTNDTVKNYLAASFLKIGVIYQLSRQFDVALKCYMDYRKLVTELSDNNPNTTEYKKNLILSNRMLGEVYLAKEEYKLAEQYFITRSELAKKLYDSNPKNSDFQKELNESYERVIAFYKNHGEAKDILPYSLIKNELAIELFVANQNNAELYNSLGLSHHELGMDYFALQQYDESKMHFLKALNIFEQIFNFTKQDIYKQNLEKCQYMIKLLQDSDI